MHQIARYVRYWFGIQPVILGLALFSYASFLFRHVDPDDLDPEQFAHHWIGAAIVIPLLMVSAVICSIAWWTLRKGKPSAQPWAIAASLVSLLSFPIGTVAGIAGLVVFSRKDTAPKMTAAPERPRLPGDGTSKALDTVVSVVQLAFLFIAMHWWDQWSAARGLPEIHGWAWAVQFEIALQTSILFHELGHVVGGWASHMKLRHFVVGPLEWVVRNGKWEFEFKLAGLWGRGLTGMVPTDLHELRSRRIFMVLGGPVASLLIGLVAVLATLLAKDSSWESYWGCFAMMATLGLSQFVVNLMPLRPQDQYSDGAHLYQLISGGPWADVHMAFSMVGSTLATPTRPRDFDADLLRRAAAFLTQGQQALLLRIFLFMHHVDAGRRREALEAFDQAEATYPEVAATLPVDLYTEFIFVNAVFKRDCTATREWWKRMEAKGAGKFKMDYWRARAAYLWMENQHEEASQAWDKGAAMARNLPAVGAYEFDRWCFDQLRQAMDATPLPSMPPPLPDCFASQPDVLEPVTV